MKSEHFLLFLFFLGVGYFLGVYFPNPGQVAVAKVQSAV